MYVEVIISCGFLMVYVMDIQQYSIIYVEPPKKLVYTTTTKCCSNKGRKLYILLDAKHVACSDKNSCMSLDPS